MARFTVGKKTASVGTDILAVCPANDVLVPVLRGFCVTTGAAEQTFYVCTPLGITWTQVQVQGGGSVVTLADMEPADNPDGAAKVLATSDLVAVIMDDGLYHASAITVGDGTADIDEVWNNSYTHDDIDVITTQLFFEDSSANGLTGIGFHHFPALAQGTTINNATLRIKTDANGSHGESIDFTIYFDDSDDSPMPTAQADIAVMTLTQIYTENGKVFEGNTWYEFDIASGLQTVVNRAGWLSGNGFSVVITLDAMSAQDVTCDFAKVGDTDGPELVVNSNANNELTAAPSNDVPYGSLAYCYYDPTEAGSVQRAFRCPANSTTLFNELWVQGGIPTQDGKLAPASGRGVPMMLLLTNDTATATLEYASFEWFDPATLADEGLLSPPAGKSARQFPTYAGEL